jgi:hypothetical protein
LNELGSEKGEVSFDCQTLLTLIDHSMNYIMEEEVDYFAYTVIEISGTALHNQCKEKIRVLPKSLGSGSYPGPQQFCLERWRHTSSFYVMKPTMMGVYIATNLHDNFHYQVLPKDFSIIEEMQRFCQKHRSKQFRMIDSMANFHDENLTVINDPRDEIVQFIGGIDDSDEGGKIFERA